MPTPNRNFRIEDDVYDPALERARREGITLTDIVNRALRAYATRPEPAPPEVAVAGAGMKWHRSRGDGATYCGKWTRDMDRRMVVDQVPAAGRCRKCWPETAA